MKYIFINVQRQFSDEMMGEQLNTNMQKMNIDSFLTLYVKISQNQP